MRARLLFKRLAEGRWRALSPRAVLVATLGVALSIAVAQSAGSDTDPLVAQAGLDKEPPVGGPRQTGDPAAPITLGSLEVNHQETDVQVATSLGAFSLTRSYTVSTDAFDTFVRYVASGQRHPFPKPFGGSPKRPHALQWWHSLYSYVEERPTFFNDDPDSTIAAAATWIVRDTSGAETRFSPCWNEANLSQACFAAPDLGSTYSTSFKTRDRLLWNGSSFTLYKPGEGRYYYQSLWQKEGSEWTRRVYFLTRIEDEQYPDMGGTGKRRTLVSLTYKSPSTCSGVPGVSENGGVPYIDKATTADEDSIQFNYVLKPNDQGTNECVLSHLTWMGRKSGDPLTGKELVRYAYPGVAGLLASVARPEAFQTVEYGYGTDTAPEWQIRINGRLVTSKRLDALHKTIQEDWTRGNTLRVTADGRCRPGAIGNPDPTDHDCPSFQNQHIIDDYVRLGDGSENYVQLSQDYVLMTTWHGPGVFTSTAGTTCVGGPCPANLGLNTQRSWKWDDLLGVPISKWEKNPRGHWTVYQHEAPANVSSNGTFTGSVLGTPAPPELKAVMIGASTSDGADALRKASFTYSYNEVTHPGGEPDAYEQRLSTSTEASVFSPGQSTVTRRRYDDRNRLTAIIRSGYTGDFRGAPGGAELKHVGTFYFDARVTDAQAPAGLTSPAVSPDPLGRTLEVHGPCFVSQVNATDW